MSSASRFDFQWLLCSHKLSISNRFIDILLVFCSNSSSISHHLQVLVKFYFCKNGPEVEIYYRWFRLAERLLLFVCQIPISCLRCVDIPRPSVTFYKFSRIILCKKINLKWLFVGRRPCRPEVMLSLDPFLHRISVVIFYLSLFIFVLAGISHLMAKFWGIP
jgi:hypothetical protein